MKLTKNEALFLYGILFRIKLNETLDIDTKDQVCDMLDGLQSFLAFNEELADNSERYDDSDGDLVSEDSNDFEEVESDEDEDVKADTYVSSLAAENLKAIKVKDEDDKEFEVEFEYATEGKDYLDVLIDGGLSIIEKVTHVMVDANKNHIHLFGRGEKLTVLETKVPKSWTKVFPPGKICGFVKETTEE